MAAYLADLAVGDPRWIPHPVVLMGKAIEKMEALFRPLAKSPAALALAGAVMWLLLVGGSYLLAAGLLKALYQVSYWLGAAAEVWLISTTLAARGLAGAGNEIYALLARGDLAEARRKVGWIVGRDTDQMDEAEVTRATVETVAENTVDGIIAPLFYAFLGGAPLALAYRAVNTLDSMVGYKNDRYRHFGMPSARLDDLVNYLPARLTGLFLLAAAALLRLRPAGALAAIRRDAAGHPSPNSGIPEAAVAGALGIRLGGLNHYQGRESFRAYMGEPVEPLMSSHVKGAVRIMYTASALAVLTGTLCGAVISAF